MQNKYNNLKVALFLNLLKKGKISPRKLWNVVVALTSYWLKKKKTASFPFILSLELGNECNIACKFCRDEKGTIHNLNADKPEEGIAKGKMPLPMALDIIDQAKNHALITVLYTNGEPLLYHDLAKVIQYSTDRKMATMIATNGLLLNDRITKDIIEAGVDLVKIQLSGFTDEIYQVQTRWGNIEKLKANIRRIVEFNRAHGDKTIILVDYILYNYNRHQLPLVREFCEELGVRMNLRPGNPKAGLEDTEKPLTNKELPLEDSCSWVWQGMQVNWNGDVLPCCEAVVWADAPVYEKYEVGKSNVKEVWNAAPAKRMRTKLSKKGGRGDESMCSKCLRTGVCFKW